MASDPVKATPTQPYLSMFLRQNWKANTSKINWGGTTDTWHNTISEKSSFEPNPTSKGSALLRNPLIQKLHWQSQEWWLVDQTAVLPLGGTRQAGEMCWQEHGEVQPKEMPSLVPQEEQPHAPADAESCLSGKPIGRNRHGDPGGQQVEPDPAGLPLQRSRPTPSWAESGRASPVNKCLCHSDLYPTRAWISSISQETITGLDLRCCYCYGLCQVTRNTGLGAACLGADLLQLT